MKKILSACIEQDIEFDSEAEYQSYIDDLRRKNQRFVETGHTQDGTGKVILHIRKQYNKNSFPGKEW